MFSLHIDTARTWRGGQNQVLLTVNGLRSIGERAALVAHPDGELRRRAAEGLDLIPIAPRTEMDLSAAWRLSRVIRRLGPDIIHAHDAHGVAMAALALSMGAASIQRAGARAPALVAARRVEDPLDVLSPREREVLSLMAEGRSNVGIAHRLWITEGTVENHVHSILRKLRLPESDADQRRVLAVITFLDKR